MEKEIDMFEENENHPMKLSINPVKFPPDKEVDASKINFSDRECIRWTINEFKKMGILTKDKEEEK